MPDDAYERASEIQQRLTETGHHRSAGPIDLLISATAERRRLTALTDNRDFLTVAAVTGHAGSSSPNQTEAPAWTQEPTRILPSSWHPGTNRFIAYSGPERREIRVRRVIYVYLLAERHDCVHLPQGTRKGANDDSRVSCDVLPEAGHGRASCRAKTRQAFHLLTGAVAGSAF
jgi:hypothetical protein